MSPFHLTISKILKPSELPSDEELIVASKEILKSTETWKHGKSHQKNKVHTFSRPKGHGDGASWHCRVSEHGPQDATFDEFWTMLGSNHSENEKEYIGDVKKVTLVKKLSPTQEIWSMYYEFGSFGVSPRVFTVLQTTYYDPNSPRTGIFTCIPVDLSEDPELMKLEESAVKGHYCSVESVKELPNGNVEWRMATTSSPGGHIPAFLVDSTMGSTISSDVPHFLNWFHTIRHKTNGFAVQRITTQDKDETLPPVSVSLSDPMGDVLNTATAGLAVAPPVSTGATAPVL